MVVVGKLAGDLSVRVFMGSVRVFMGMVWAFLIVVDGHF